MKTLKSPFIAAWLLDRFGADPQLDAVAGDLLEQYRLGRSRLWYWREVITAITVGTSTAFRDHTLVMLRALVIGWVVTYMSTWISGPLVYSIMARLIENWYAYNIPFVTGLLIGGPWCVSIGWIVAQCARQCRIPAVLSFAMSFLLLGLISLSNSMILQGASSFELLLSLCGPTTLTILILFGGGLLTGPPKRSILAPPGTPLDESSES
jgi:hypothetical protein